MTDPYEKKARKLADSLRLHWQDAGFEWVVGTIAAALKEATEAETERCVNVLTEFASELGERGHFQEAALLEDGAAAIRSSKTERGE